MKNIPGFKVLINDELITVAGISDVEFGSTICVLDSVRRQIDNSEHLKLTVSGMNDTKDMLTWCKEDLKLGDVIQLEVVEGSFNSPIEVRPFHKTEAEILERKIKQYHKLKEELKDCL